MPAGLQVWDENGNLIVDLTTRLGRILGYQVIPATAGSLVHPGFATGTPFAFALPGPDSTLQSSRSRPLITSINPNTNTLTWSVPFSAQWPPSVAVGTRLLVYGVY